MKEIKNKEHDFGAKLRQESVIDNLREYASWLRDFEASGELKPLPNFGPVSINLDLTAACNFACPHCVDSGIINTGEELTTKDIKATIDTLAKHGLKSVILIGGGEPTLHKGFGEIVRQAKDLDMQVGVVTNGSRLNRVAEIAQLFKKGDWVRLSIDAATEETFRAAHCQAKAVTLKGILEDAMALKELNPNIQLGYSYVIVWDEIFIDDKELCANVDEMVAATKLARDYKFDYISFKPCLLRLEGSKRESLFNDTDQENETRVIEAIRANLAAAQEAAGDLKVLESVNLIAMLEKKVAELKKQPTVCHSQFYRTVVAPAGIFHCPAFRGVEKGRLADCQGYIDEKRFKETHKALAKSITTFDAAKECDVVVCFYHHVNWWMDNLIHSKEGVDELEVLEDNNFFF